MDLYRVLRKDNSADPPVAGDARGGALIGDFATKRAAKAACAGPGVFYIEPVKFNEKPEAPVYENNGEIEEVTT